MSYVRRAEAVTLIGLKLHVLAAGAHWFNSRDRAEADARTDPVNC